MSPYNLNPNTVERWKEVLDAIVNNYGATIVVEPCDAHMTAYKLREALRAARHHKLTPYDQIEYQFHADIENNKVVCSPKNPNLGLNIGVLAPEATTYPEAYSAFDVVEIATTEKADLMSFPSFSDDVESVRSWAESRGYEISSTRPLTLRKIT